MPPPFIPGAIVASDSELLVQESLGRFFVRVNPVDNSVSDPIEPTWRNVRYAHGAYWVTDAQGRPGRVKDPVDPGFVPIDLGPSSGHPFLAFGPDAVWARTLYDSAAIRIDPGDLSTRTIELPGVIGIVPGSSMLWATQGPGRQGRNTDLVGYDMDGQPCLRRTLVGAEEQWNGGFLLPGQIPSEIGWFKGVVKAPERLHTRLVAFNRETGDELLRLDVPLAVGDSVMPTRDGALLVTEADESIAAKSGGEWQHRNIRVRLEDASWEEVELDGEPIGALDDGRGLWLLLRRTTEPYTAMLEKLDEASLEVIDRIELPDLPDGTPIPSSAHPPTFEGELLESLRARTRGGPRLTYGHRLKDVQMHGSFPSTYEEILFEDEVRLEGCTLGVSVPVWDAGGTQWDLAGSSAASIVYMNLFEEPPAVRTPEACDPDDLGVTWTTGPAPYWSTPR